MIFSPILGDEADASSSSCEFDSDLERGDGGKWQHYLSKTEKFEVNYITAIASLLRMLTVTYLIAGHRRI